eukprot:TRINITY_DN5913_c0_g1_i1.p1 TRINITY_DN5913_c0_g1~~TRINITY_DN5913_c0_g1_i1.p1  ORF type:complete len:843 (+),score=236.49 TRINITY_DN5913_c0_g1_i1:207-2735(+)
MSACFSDKAWSGTPMWQIAEELEAQRQKRDEEERRKASTPVAVLNIRVEGDYHLSELILFIPSKAVSPQGTASEASGFREVKVRGPRRLSRREAMKDGFELRDAFLASGEAEVRRLQRELASRTWAPGELPREDAAVEQAADREMRLRLAQRPSGTGWSRKKDAEFFVHTHSPMAYDPKKRQYYTIDEATQQYVPCDPPHDPTEYPIGVAAGASLVGKSDADLASPARPRTILLKELVPTGRAMRKPLFFLDQPASCFVLLEGLRGSAAVDYCARNVHTKLLSRLSSTLQFWSDALVEGLLNSILEELDAELLQQATTCYDGVSIAVALLLGDRLLVATLGAVRALLRTPRGDLRVLGREHHVAEEGPERQRVDAAFGEVVPAPSASAGGSGTPASSASASPAASRLALRRALLPRDCSSAQDAASEIQRVLERAPDSFAVLGFGAEDVADAKTAKAHYRKLALKVHPDKAPEDLKDRAKEAFAKVETALERVEALLDADGAAAALLQKLLAAAGDVLDPVLPRAKAIELLGIEEAATPEEAEKKAKHLRTELAKFGQFADGRLGHQDAVRAGRLLDEALEALAAPVPREGACLEAVPVTRALGLRDLKRPHAIAVATPRIEAVQLDEVGHYQFALLSSSAAALGDKEIAERLRSFPRQPKLASLVTAQDASKQLADAGASAAACLAGVVVGSFEVELEKAEEAPAAPAAKKARTEQRSDKVRCLHILLKHKELKMTKDAESMQRMKGKAPVSRTAAQAERELLEMQRALLANPNIFHTLARKHSECDTAMQPGQNAGDLGWVSRGTVAIPQLEAAMFALKVYEVSDIIATPRGLHILQRIA